MLEAELGHGRQQHATARNAPGTAQRSKIRNSHDKDTVGLLGCCWQPDEQLEVIRLCGQVSLADVAEALEDEDDRRRGDDGELWADGGASKDRPCVSACRQQRVRRG